MTDRPTDGAGAGDRDRPSSFAFAFASALAFGDFDRTSDRLIALTIVRT